MKKVIIIVTLLTFFTKILGFFRDVILSYYYGASDISDAYLVAMTIPTTLFALIGVGIVASYIPIASSIIEKRGEKYLNIFTGNLLFLFLIISGIIIVLALIFPELLIKIFASGFDDRAMDISVRFTRVLTFSIFFSGIIYILNGYLEINKSFYYNAFAGIPLNLIMIFSIVISYYTVTDILVYGSLGAIIIQASILIYGAKKTNFSFKVHLKGEGNLKDLKNLIIISIPVIIGISVNQINFIIDRNLASQISEGAVSALTYANRISLLVQGIFITTLLSVLYPRFAKMYIKKDFENFEKNFIETLITLIIFIFPISFFLLGFSTEVVEILFKRGAFDNRALELTAIALFYYSIGIIGFGLRELLTKIYYSMGDTKTPLINGVIAAILNIILNIILTKFLGIGGLALASSLSALITTILLYMNLKKKVEINQKKVYINFFKVFIISLFSVVIMKMFNSILEVYLIKILSITLSFVIGYIIYLVLLLVLKVEYFSDFLKNLYKIIIAYLKKNRRL